MVMSQWLSENMMIYLRWISIDIVTAYKTRVIMMRIEGDRTVSECLAELWLDWLFAHHTYHSTCFPLCQCHSPPSLSLRVILETRIIEEEKISLRRRSTTSASREYAWWQYSWQHWLYLFCFAFLSICLHRPDICASVRSCFISKANRKSLPLTLHFMTKHCTALLWTLIYVG